MAPSRVPSVGLLRYLRAHEIFTAAAVAPLKSSRACRPAIPPRSLNRARTRPITTFIPSYAIPVESSVLSFWPSRAKKPVQNQIESNAQQLPTERAQQARCISSSLSLSDYKESRLNRLWDFRRKKAREPLQPDDLPTLSSLDEHSGLGRIVKPASLKLRCTEFDDQGNIVLNNGEFRKNELIAKYGLLPRDLRKIDISTLPNILVRPAAILINLLHLRVLIKNDRVLVFDAYGSSDTYTQSLFMYDLEQKLRSPEQRTAGSSQAGGALPYEFRALESVLVSVTTGLEGEFEGVREPVVRVLRELEEDIDRDKLRHLLIYSKKLSSFEQKARLVRDAIDDLLEADDDLAAMYLSEKTAGRPRTETDHTEVEMLLESYYKITEEIVQSSSNLVSNIRNTEEIVKAILDANRNSLMLLELKFTIWALGLGGGTFIASLYGMNLENFIEETDWGMSAVVGTSVFVTWFLMRFGQRKLDKVTRISMWGKESAGVGGRNGWGKFKAEKVVRAGAEGKAGRDRERYRAWEALDEKGVGRPLGPGSPGGKS